VSKPQDFCHAAAELYALAQEQLEAAEDKNSAQLLAQAARIEARAYKVQAEWEAKSCR
jgi:hypothetical protein